MPKGLRVQLPPRPQSYIEFGLQYALNRLTILYDVMTELYEQIKSFFQSGDYSGARDFLNNTKQQFQDQWDYWYYLAHAERKIGNLAQAEDFCKSSLELTPDSQVANFEMGIIYQTKGDYKKATEHIKKVVEGFSEETEFSEKIDTLNSLALTYKMAKDTDNAFKYYNQALEVLVQELYDWIKSNSLIEIVEPPRTRPTSETWMNLAMQIAVKNSAKDGMVKALFPTGETAIKLMQQNSLIGRPFYDEGNTRYVLPTYLSAFADELKRNVWYSTILNNVAMLYADTAEIRKAGEVFMESIDFLPPSSSYNAPILNFEELKKKYGDREYWK